MTDDELLLAISEMMDKKLHSQDSKFESIDQKFERIDRRFDQIDQRFEQVDRRFDQIDQRFEQVDQRFEQVDQRFDQIDQRFEKMDRRVDTLEDSLKSTQEEVHFIRLQQENVVLPRLQNIESCYLSTYERYRGKADQIDQMQCDVDIMKRVLRNHTERLEKIS